MLDQLAGEEYGFGRLWEESMSYLRQCMAALSKLLDSKFPKIVEKFTDNGIPIMAFGSQFFITGYMYNLPFDMAARVWDSFWLRKFDFLYAIGVAIMKLSSDILLKLELEEMMSFFQFKETDSIPFTIEQLIENSTAQFPKLKITTIRKWENEVGDALKAEKQQIENREKKLKTLEKDKKARDLDRKMNEATTMSSDIHRTIDVSDIHSQHHSDTAVSDVFVSKSEITDNLSKEDTTEEMDDFTAVMNGEDTPSLPKKSPREKKKKKPRRKKITEQICTL